MIDYLRLFRSLSDDNRCQQSEHKPSLSLLWRLLDTGINNVFYSVHKHYLKENKYILRYILGKLKEKAIL